MEPRRAYKRVYALEIVIAAIWMSFGAVFLYPTDSFSNSTAYRVIALVASEEVWGVLFLLFGAALLVAALSGNRGIRRTAMFSALVAMLGFDVTFWMSSITSAASTYAVICVASLWCYLRLWRKDA